MEQEGVFVREVSDGSPAAEAGIRPGMVIDQVADKKVGSVKEFKAALPATDAPAFVHVVGKGIVVIPGPGGKKEAPKKEEPKKEEPKKESPKKPQ